MGAARLGFVATFLSDPLISGFTTGSAVLVVISQLKHILGLKIPQISGALAAPKVNLDKIALILKLKNSVFLTEHVLNSRLGITFSNIFNNQLNLCFEDTYQSL